MQDDFFRFQNKALTDLGRKNFQMVQSQEGLRLTEDAVLLAALTAEKIGSKKSYLVADLCAGSGGVALLLLARLPKIQMQAAELLPEWVALAQKNIVLNQLEKRMQITKADIKRWAQMLKEKKAARIWQEAEGKFDVIVSNPPYFLPERCLKRTPEQEERSNQRTRFRRDVAVQEIKMTFADLCQVTARLLKPKGKFFFIHTAGRLPELLQTLSSFKLEPRYLRMIHPKRTKRAGSIFMMAEKGAASGGFTVAEPLIVRNADNSYTPEVEAIYQES